MDFNYPRHATKPFVLIGLRKHDIISINVPAGLLYERITRRLYKDCVRERLVLLIEYVKLNSSQHIVLML